MVPQTHPLNTKGDDHTHHDESNDPDLPPDSSWVPSENEFEWFDRNSFIQRTCSIKVTVSRISDRGSSTQRSSSFNLKQKSSIIGLLKFRKSSLADANLKRNTKLENIRLFRSRSDPGGNKSLQVTEPGSPKVSCMGRVGSRKRKGKRNGLWASFKGVFL